MVKAPHGQAYDVYINMSSGTASQYGKKRLRQIIKDSLLVTEKIHLLQAKTFFKRLTALTKKEAVRPILIGGGDGTIKSVAEILSSKNIPFGVLPFGTMNLLSKDLEIPEKLENALAAYNRKTVIKKIDVGYVNKEMFLCCAGLGTMPETSVYREEHRGESEPILIPQLMAYMMNEMDKMSRRRLQMDVDGTKRRLRASCIVVSNNTYDVTDEWVSNSFKRRQLQDGILGVYAATPRGLWQKILFLLRLTIGGWQKEPMIKHWRGKKVSIHTKRAQELLSLDGETVELKTPLRFTLEKKALSVIVPKA